MANGNHSGDGGVYIKCAYPSGVKLKEGQTWTVVKTVPANSPFVVMWFKAMSEMLKRKREQNKQVHPNLS